MPPLVKIPADDLIDSWDLCQAIARAVCPADDEPIVGIRCIVRGRLLQRSVIGATVATLDDQSQQAACSDGQTFTALSELRSEFESSGQIAEDAFFEFDLSIEQRHQLIGLLPSLPPLSYPTSSEMIDSFMNKYREHEGRSRWEPVFVSEADVAYQKLEQLRVHSEHLKALEADQEEGRLIAVDSRHIPVSGLGFGSLISKKDAIAYLARCHLAFSDGVAAPGSVSVVEDKVGLSIDERSAGLDSGSGANSDAVAMPEFNKLSMRRNFPGVEAVVPLRLSNHEQFDSTITIVRLKQVERMTGLARSSIYNRMDSRSRYFDPTFPRSFPLGEKGAAVGWYEHEIQEWAKKQGER